MTKINGIPFLTEFLRPPPIEQEEAKGFGRKGTLLIFVTRLLAVVDLRLVVERYLDNHSGRLTDCG